MKRNPQPNDSTPARASWLGAAQGVLAVVSLVAVFVKRKGNHLTVALALLSVTAVLVL